MKQYHKINTVYKRDEKGKIIIGDYSMPEFEYLLDCEWIFTEKIDGTNIRILWDGEHITFAGKTDKAEIPSFLLENLHLIFAGKQVLFSEIFGGAKEVCLYGEGFGDRVKKAGKKYREDSSFILFDVKVGGWWLDHGAVDEIAKKLDLAIVPVLLQDTLRMAVMMEKHYPYFSAVALNPMIAEGIVGKPKVPLFSKKGERIIVKIKACDFEATK